MVFCRSLNCGECRVPPFGQVITTFSVYCYQIIQLLEVEVQEPLLLIFSFRFRSAKRNGFSASAFTISILIGCDTASNSVSELMPDQPINHLRLKNIVLSSLTELSGISDRQFFIYWRFLKLYQNIKNLIPTNVKICNHSVIKPIQPSAP